MSNALAEIPQTRTLEASPVTPMRMIEMAVERGASIEQMQQLYELKLRVDADEARKAFNVAMAKFKDNPPRIIKDKHVKFQTQKGITEYDHSTLGHVVDQVTAALAAVGIAHKWKPIQQGSTISVTCILTHSLGHSEDTTLSAGADDSGGKNSIQAIGSTVTYLERYTLLAAVGMAASADDDAAAAGPISQGVGLSEEDFLSLRDNIEAAETETELKKFFATAYKSAQETGDKSAMQKFIDAKDKRKDELK